MGLTITEALGELRVIEKRLAKKREALLAFATGYEELKDPIDEDGGSPAWCLRTAQSIRDLMERHVAIRTAIQRSNLETELQLQGRKRTVAEWLTWRRELAKGSLDSNRRLLQKIEQDRKQWETKVTSLKQQQRDTVQGDEDIPTVRQVPTLRVNVPEMTLRGQIENDEAALEEFDTKLTLLNSTTTIELEN